MYVCKSTFKIIIDCSKNILPTIILCDYNCAEVNFKSPPKKCSQFCFKNCINNELYDKLIVFIKTNFIKNSIKLNYKKLHFTQFNCQLNIYGK